MNKKYKKQLKKLKKFLLVEDGSIHTDNLENWAEVQGIQIITYRQGSAKPELKNLKEKKL